MDFLDAVLNGTAVSWKRQGAYRVYAAWNDGTCDLENLATGETVEDVPQEEVNCYQVGE